MGFGIANNIISIREIMLRFPAILIALTFRTFAEAFTAYIMGDKSQKYNGRLSISPKAHLDPIGFLMMFLLGFGWSKPVHVDYNSFKNKRLSMALYFISGTLMNIVIAIVVTRIYDLLQYVGIEFEEIYVVLGYIIVFNLLLASFSLLPIPPLSGYYFLLQILPKNISMRLKFLEKYSLIILFILIFTGIIRYLTAPIYAFLNIIINILT